MPTLVTAMSQEGFELVITLSRRGVKYTQPAYAEFARHTLRAENKKALIGAFFVPKMSNLNQLYQSKIIAASA